jgi:hypothetical protein
MSLSFSGEGAGASAAGLAVAQIATEKAAKTVRPGSNALTDPNSLRANVPMMLVRWREPARTYHDLAAGCPSTRPVRFDRRKMNSCDRSDVSKFSRQVNRRTLRFGRRICFHDNPGVC